IRSDTRKSSTDHGHKKTKNKPTYQNGDKPEWPQPKNVQEVRQFFGLANYYRRFIKNFGLIAAPLSELFKEHGGDKRKKRPIVWNMAHQLAFARLKQAATNAPVLHQPDPMKPYTIETDASAFALGYALMRQGEDELMHP